MTFQFTCPQGHLLEGDPTHAGQPSQCPMCGSDFIIPPPPAVTQTDPSAGVEQSGQPAGAAGGFPGIQFGPDAGQAAGPAEEEIPSFGATPADDAERLIHIICPNGHELETPMDMVGADAMCPHCSSQFRLRFEDSLEYKEERKREQERREAAFGKSALRWSIVMAVLVILGLVALIVYRAMS